MPTCRSLCLLALILSVGLMLPVDVVHACRGADSASVEFAPSEDARAIRSLRRQIAAEELAAALQLSDSQKVEVVALITEHQARKAARRAQRSGSEAQARALLEDYLDEVQRAGSASAPTIADLQGLRSAHRHSPGQRGEGRGELRQRMRTILSEQQVNTLRSFRPMPELRPELGAGHERGAPSAELGAGHERGAPGAEWGDAPDAERRGKARPGKKSRKKRKMKRIARILLSGEMLDVLSR